MLRIYAKIWVNTAVASERRTPKSIHVLYPTRSLGQERSKAHISLLGIPDSTKPGVLTSSKSLESGSGEASCFSAWGLGALSQGKPFNLVAVPTCSTLQLAQTVGARVGEETKIKVLCRPCKTRAKERKEAALASSTLREASVTSSRTEARALDDLDTRAPCIVCLCFASMRPQRSSQRGWNAGCAFDCNRGCLQRVVIVRKNQRWQAKIWTPKYRLADMQPCMMRCSRHVLMHYIPACKDASCYLAVSTCRQACNKITRRFQWRRLLKCWLDSQGLRSVRMALRHQALGGSDGAWATAFVTGNNHVYTHIMSLRRHN